MTLREIQAGGGGASGALVRAGLSVLSVGYGGAVRVRAAAYAAGLAGKPRALPVPVVSIGNIVAGGTGKTPFVAWLAKRLAGLGRRPGVLSRGYGPRGEGQDLSDEGAVLRDLLGLAVPQVEDPDRVRGGRRLLSERPATDLLLLDDGFQHRRLARDLDVVLLDATSPFGFGRLLPRGLLREPLTALARAGAFVATRAESAPKEEVEATLRAALAHAPRALTAVAKIVPRALVSARGDERPPESVRDQAVFAYAGIANPQAFSRTLEALGARLVGKRWAPDHFLPVASDVLRLAAEARAAGASLIAVTRKDLVKLRALPNLPENVVAVDVTVRVIEGEKLLLDRILSLKRDVKTGDPKPGAG